MSLTNGPSELAVKEAAWGLARYAAISQVILYIKQNRQPFVHYNDNACKVDPPI